MINQTVILQAMVYGFLNGSIYVLISIGFTMVFGVMGIINFAYGQLAVLAMYTTLFLYKYYNIDPFFSIVITAPLFFVIGIGIYKSFIRHLLNVPHYIQMIATLGFMIFLESIMLFAFKGTPRGITTPYTTTMLPLLGEIKINYPRLIATMISFSIIISLFLFLKKTTLGKEIQAAADHQEGAMLVGIETDKVFMIAFAVVCVLEAVAGSATVSFYVVDPFTGFSLGLKAFIVVVMGGLGSIPGAVVSGLIVGIVESLSAVFISASLGTGVLFLILAVALILRPSGLFVK